MTQIADPRELALEHPALAEIGMTSVWLAKTKEAIDDLAYIVGTLDLPPEGVVSTADQYTVLWEADPLAIAHYLVCANHHEVTKSLEALVAAWLSADPGNWATLCRLIFDRWHEIPGHWNEDTPAWVRTLDPIATSARNFDPFGPRPS